jgi:hypothetical protein
MDKLYMIIYMTENQIVKSLYHAFAFIFLCSLIFMVRLSTLQKIAVLFIAIFHLYDTYWFFNYTSNAPI